MELASPVHRSSGLIVTIAASAVGVCLVAAAAFFFASQAWLVGGVCAGLALIAGVTALLGFFASKRGLAKGEEGVAALEFFSASTPDPTALEEVVPGTPGAIDGAQETQRATSPHPIEEPIVPAHGSEKVLSDLNGEDKQKNTLDDAAASGGSQTGEYLPSEGMIQEKTQEDALSDRVSSSGVAHEIVPPNTPFWLAGGSLATRSSRRCSTAQKAFWEYVEGRKPVCDAAAPKGIVNGGNTCYLASALQVLRYAPSLLARFDPRRAPLQRRENEDEELFRARQRVQQLIYTTFEILENKTVSQRGICAIREACRAVGEDGGQLVGRGAQQADAVDTFKALLAVVDFRVENPYWLEQEQPFPASASEFKVLKKPVLLEDYEAYSTLEDLASGGHRPGIFHLCPEQGQAVAMNDLIIAWRESAEWLSDRKMIASEEVREYKISVRTKQLVVPNPVPESICFTIKQNPSFREKAWIHDAEWIKPFGDQGPTYQLKGLIEHSEAHYVAKVRSGDDYYELNDGKVFEIDDLSGMGVLYLYELSSGF